MEKPAVIFVSMPRDLPDGKKYTFDMDYYLNKHMSLVDKYWSPHGLLSYSIIQFPPGDPSGLFMINQMHWKSVQAWEEAFAMMIPEVMQDMANFTDWQGDISWWIGSELLSSRA